MKRIQLGLMLKVIGCFIFIGASFNSYSEIVELNWNKLIHLDAEYLNEQGIKETYEELVLPDLKQYITVKPVDIQELFNKKTGAYKVIAGSKTYIIYDPITQNTLRKSFDSWGYATYALFDIVNQQLVDSEYKFYAFNSGHELSGMFLTPNEYKDYSKQLCQNESTSQDCPYLPTLELPWFGQYRY